MKHSQAPFITKISPSGNTFIYAEGGAQSIAGIVRLGENLTIEQSVANTRLFCAAPELLETMERIVSFLADLNGCRWIESDSDAGTDMNQRARALQLIAFDITQKAKGMDC
jgi:hypothetical protein